MSKQLSQYARVEVQKLMEQTGHEITLDDFDDIMRLNDLCNAVNDNSSEHNDILDMPVRVGPYILHQPKLGALQWFNERAVQWFGDDGLLLDKSLAYALSRSCYPDDLWELENKAVAKLKILFWARRLDCTHQELSDALLSVLKVDAEGKDVDDDPNSNGKLIAMLCREYGHEADYWMWESPLSIITTFVNDYVSRIEAENAAARKAASPGSKPPMSDTKLKRISDMRAFVKELREKWLTKR